LLVSRRRTWADALPVTWVKLLYPGERNEFVGEFNPLDSLT
jgi:GntR family histidine utilization transcriptional repressor